MRTLLLTLTTCLFVLPAQAKYSGGSGTAQDPYRIATAADLITLGETPADYDKHFVLTANIDLDPKLPGRKVFEKAVIAPDTNPTGQYHEFQGPPFTGVLGGKGHVVRHLTISGKDYVGLFGELASRAEVKDLGVVDVNITGSGAYVGGLAGSNGTWLVWGGGSVVNCYSTGAVSGKDGVGTLVGYNYSGGTVTQCYCTGAVSTSSSSTASQPIGGRAFGDHNVPSGRNGRVCGSSSVAPEPYRGRGQTYATQVSNGARAGGPL